MIGDDFARKLKQAAGREDETFSPTLHARVMVDIRQGQIAPAYSVRWRLWLPLATIAAAAAIVVAFWPRPQRPRPAAPPQAIVIGLPRIPSLRKVVAEVTEPVREKLNSAKFAYLDRDAKHLANFLWHSVPGVPVE